MAIMGAYGSAIVFGVLDPYNDWGSRTMIRPEEMKRLSQLHPVLSKRDPYYHRYLTQDAKEPRFKIDLTDTGVR